MIDKNSLAAAIGAAENITSQGKQLHAVEDSALAHIIGSMDAGLHTDLVDDLIPARVAEEARNDEHDGAMYNLADLAAQSVINTHRLSTNTVVPHILRVLEISKRNIEESESKDPVCPYSINFVDGTSLPDNDALNTVLDGMANMDPLSSERVNVGVYSDDEVLEAVKFSNVDDFDSIMANCLVTKPSAMKLVQSVFSGESTVDFIRSEVNDVPEVFVAIMIMALSLKDSEQIQQGINVPYATYQNRMFNIAIDAARVYRDHMLKWSTLANTLYLDKRTDKTISLNREFFMKLSEATGITVESIFANESLGRKYTSSQMHDPQVRAELDAQAAKEQATRNRQHEIDTNRRLNQSVLKAVMEDARDADVGQLAILGDTPESLTKRANVVCNRIWDSKRVTGDLEQLVAGVLISIYYAHTDVALYLNSMSVNQTKYPTMSPADLAKLARAELIVHYVARQIGIS